MSQPDKDSWPTPPSLVSPLVPHRVWILPGAALAAIVGGGVLWFFSKSFANQLWLFALLATGSLVVIRTIREILHGRWASDVVAALAIVVAVIINEPLAGLIVVVMQSGGEALERMAEGRASKAVRMLEADRPQQAHRLRDGVTSDIPANDVEIGDLLVIRPGELVPCDGVVVEGSTSIDASRLTGEPLPVAISPGSVIQSGSVNGSRVFTMRATALARESQYEQIVRLVRTAQASKAPFQRLADQYAVWFTPLTIILAVTAALLSRDWNRVLAVLVVATPCPLILAPPIAIIGGINRAARRQIITRNGGAVEKLADIEIAIFDKTGTLTIGKPAVSEVLPSASHDRQEVLRAAASVEQGSGHLLARALVDAADAEHVTLSPVYDSVEAPGQGIVGTVDGDTVAVGSYHFIQEHVDSHDAQSTALPAPVGLTAYVAVNGQFVGLITYADRLRPQIHDMLEELKTLGIKRMMLLSGDHTKNVTEVAHAVGTPEAHGALLPEDKVRLVKALSASGHRVLMVGDGTNDAPALSAATVGIALAGHGGGVTTEAADVIILVDDVTRIPDAIRISHKTMQIARQCIWAGLGLSGIAMVVAALGYIDPVPGALLQEGIDIAVILNALRASADDARPVARGKVSLAREPSLS